MARDLKAKIRIEADTRQANAQLGKTEEQIEKVEKSSTDLDKSFGKLRSGIRKVVAVVGTLSVAFAGVIKAFTTQEKAVSALNIALGNAAGASSSLSKRLQEQADALSKLTGIGDEEILQVQSRIALFTKEEAQIKALTAAAIDFAAARGRNATEIADALIRSIVTENNALTEQGIVITGAAGSVERYNSALQSLSITQGAAARNANTTTSEINKLWNAFGDLFQEIGRVIGETEGFRGVLRRLTAGLRSIESSVTDVAFAIKNFGLTVAAVADSILPRWLSSLLGIEGSLSTLGVALELNREQLRLQALAAENLANRQEKLNREKAEAARIEAALVEEERLRQIELEKQAKLLEDEVIPATEKYALDLVVLDENLNRVRATEQAYTVEVIEGAQARTAARAQEAELAQNLLGGQSEFAQIGGGTFFIPAPVETDANGRIRRAPPHRQLFGTTFG